MEVNVGKKYNIFRLTNWYNDELERKFNESQRMWNFDASKQKYVTSISTQEIESEIFFQALHFW